MLATAQVLLNHWFFFGLGSLAIYFVGAAIYNLWISPLAKYPGPFFARISAWPSFYHAITGDRHVWIWRCHQIHGDVFRYHPSGVMINSPDGYNDIYNHKANVRKGKFYEIWSRNARNNNTLTTVDKVAHARKRRTLSSAFSDKALRSAESFIVQHVERWCKLLLDGDGQDWSEPRNLARWSDSLLLDILGELCFGRSFGLKEAGENPLKAMPHAITSYTSFMYPITQSPMLEAWLWLKPRGLNYLLECIAPKEVKEYYGFVEASVSERADLEVKGQGWGDGEKEQRKDIFHYLFHATDPDSGTAAYSPEELDSEANLLIIAGSDTTAVALCGLFFYLTRNARVHAKIVTEIRSAFSRTCDIRSGASLSSCVYLRACIDEALRMCPAGASEFVREVLPGGAEVAGDFFPAGVRLGTASWAINYHDEHFPDPFVYRPERWIVDPAAGVTADEVAAARSCVHPFSAGPASCLGKNLALIELAVTAARVLHAMDVRAAPGSTLGEGAPTLGWGRRRRNQYQLGDAYISLRDGPMLQFRNFSGTRGDQAS